MYQIPVISTAAIKQQKAAKYIHLCAAFLMMANAWGEFNSTANPRLTFVVIQIAISIKIIFYIYGGKKFFSKPIFSHRPLRILEVVVFAYSAHYFYTQHHQHLISLLQAVTAIGLFYLFFSERKSFQKQFIQINEQGILLPAVDQMKPLLWSSIDNLRIRNDYISINTKENRFIQYENGTPFSETELDKMNAWCFQQIAATNNPTSQQS
ncbi:MAG: hypothetical protein ACK55K_05515 [Bacteroidota bacterium]